MKPIQLRIFLVFVCFVVSILSSNVNSNETESYKDSKIVLDSLKAGNERFIKGERQYPHLNAKYVKELVNGQHPTATIIACSDSRVSPEHILDSGLGDLFIIRVAGNVCNVDEIGSIEYGVGHLKTPLMVVMGHTHCGAVTAVVEGSELHGNIPALVKNIVPIAEKVKHKGNINDKLIYEAVKENVWQSIHDLISHSEITRDQINEGELTVIGAIYHLEDGHVEWLGEYPDQEDIMKQVKSDSNP